MLQKHPAHVWLYREGDGVLTGMGKVTEYTQDEVTPGQSDTNHSTPPQIFSHMQGR